MCEPRDEGTAKQEPKLARGAVSGAIRKHTKQVALDLTHEKVIVQ